MLDEARTGLFRKSNDGFGRAVTDSKESFVKSGVLHAIQSGTAGIFGRLPPNMQHYSANVGNGIGRFFSQAGHANSSFFLELRNLFATSFERIERTITGLFSSLTTAIVSIFQATGQGIASCLHWIVSTSAWCWTALTSAVSSLWFGVQHATTFLLHRIVQILNALIQFVAGTIIILSILLVLYASTRYVLRIINHARLWQEIANQEAGLVGYLEALRLEEERQQVDEEERLCRDRKLKAERFRLNTQAEEDRK